MRAVTDREVKKLSSINHGKQKGRLFQYKDLPNTSNSIDLFIGNKDKETLFVNKESSVEYKDSISIRGMK